MNESSPQHFDLCVIGAGAAGLSVASGAAQLGLHVALIEKGEMGGDCLNTGCVPSKAMLAAAHKAHIVKNSESFGVTTSAPDINYAAVHKHIGNVIKTIEPHDSQERFEGLGVTVIREHARFTARDTIQAGSHTISAKNFVIAAGTRTALPPIDGLDPAKVLTNENLFALKTRPEHLIIIGGGPIGVEMAQAHKRLGSKVTLIERAEILPKDDPHMVAIIRRALTDEGVKLFEKSDIMDIEHTESGASVRLTKDNGDQHRIDGTHILIATGRTPNTDSLDLDKAGVTVNEKGIVTDKRLRTSNKKIYAAGDIAGGPQFTHIAGYHAGIIIRNLIFRLPAKTDYTALPWVTYTDPELAQVGMTEAMARDKHGDSIKVIGWKLAENDRAIAEKRTDGMIKVITDKKGRILGASIVAPQAGEMIGLWGLAISEKLKIGAIANMIAPYPTFGEISKRAAGSYYTASLFSDKTRFLTSLLRKLPL